MTNRNSIIAILMGCAVSACGEEFEDFETEEGAVVPVAAAEETLIGPGPNCRRVDIEVTNGRSVSIRVDNVSAFSVDDDRWYVESLRDRTVEPGGTEVWESQQLRDVRGDVISHWRIRYDRLENGRWRRGLRYEDNVVDRRCQNDSTHRMTVR